MGISPEAFFADFAGHKRLCDSDDLTENNRVLRVAETNGHMLYVTWPYVWCGFCGCIADITGRRVLRLGEPCRKQAAKGQKALFYLLKSRHPYTGAKVDAQTFRFRNGFREAIADGELETLAGSKVR